MSRGMTPVWLPITISYDNYEDLDPLSNAHSAAFLSETSQRA